MPEYPDNIELKKRLKKDDEAYDAFWGQFGKVLKEGLIPKFTFALSEAEAQYVRPRTPLGKGPYLNYPSLIENVMAQAILILLMTL